MSFLAKRDDQWIPLQTTVFSRWISEQYKKPIDDLEKDLSSGVVLIELAQILTGKQAPHKWSKNPKHTVQKVENCDLAIQMFKNDGIKLVGISGKDIVDGNTKLILGLIWSLINHYTIERVFENAPPEEATSNGEQRIPLGRTNSQLGLLDWASHRTSNSNFKPYELGMCSLLDSYYPERISYHNLDPEAHESNAQLAVDVMKEAGIPVYVYPEDLTQTNYLVDRKSLMVQLAAAKEVFNTFQPTFSQMAFDIHNSDNEPTKSVTFLTTEHHTNDDDIDLKNTKEYANTEVQVTDDNKNNEKLYINIGNQTESSVYIDAEIQTTDDETHHKASTVYSSTEIQTTNDQKVYSNSEIQATDNDDTHHKDQKVYLSTEIQATDNDDTHHKDQKVYSSTEIQATDNDDTHHQNVKVTSSSETNDDDNQIDREIDLNSNSNTTDDDQEQFNNEAVNIENYVAVSNQELLKGNQRKVKVLIRRKNGDVKVKDLEQITDDNAKLTLSPTKDGYVSPIKGKVLTINIQRNGEMVQKTVHKSFNSLKIVLNNNKNQSEKLIVNSKGETIDTLKEVNKTIDRNDPNSQPPIESQYFHFISANQLYNEKEFFLTMNLHESEYNHGNKVDINKPKAGRFITLALTVVMNSNDFINPAGKKLDLAPLNMNDNLQRFMFGKDQWNTVIDSVHKKGLVWEVGDQNENDAPFYLFPFNGRQNQHFIYDDFHIRSIVNDDVVTYVGGPTPFVMMKPDPSYKTRQTFYIHLM